MANAIWLPVLDGPSVKDDLAGVRRVETRDDVEKRGLAGTVRPADAEYLTGLDLKIQLANRSQGAEIFIDALAS